MATRSGPKCQYGSCGNQQHQGYEPYCYLHAGMSASFLSTATTLGRPSHKDEFAQISRPAMPKYDGIQIQAINSWYQFTEHAEKIHQSIESWLNGKSIDVETTPDNAVANRDSNIKQIKSLLIDNGIKHNDIVTLRFTGLRRGHSTRVFSNFSHDVIGVYDNNRKIAVIDPAVSMLAPVRQKQRTTPNGTVLQKTSDQPIDRTFGSGKTMYGDLPLVCSFEEYMKNQDFSFESVEEVF